MRTVIRCFGILVFIFTLSTVAGVNCNAQSDETSNEQIEQLLADADSHFKRQEFLAGYGLYRRVLSLDPMHQAAREKIYEIARIYKTLEEIAQSEENQTQVELLHRQYRSIVRYLMKVLTSQLSSMVQTYGEYIKAENQGSDVDEEIHTVLDNLLKVLHELKSVYEQFPREDSTAMEMVERLNGAIAKYQKELAAYSNPD